MRCMVLGAFAVGLATSGAAEPVLLEGAPRTGWASGHFCQQVDALHAVLGAMGCQMSYEELLVASGCAFKMVWCPGRYSFFAVDHGPEDYILTGAEAVGAAARRQTHASEEEAWATTKAALDAGQAIITWRGTGARAILGYDEVRGIVFKRDYHSSGPEYDEIAFEAQDAPPPLKAPREVLVLSYIPGDEAPEFDWPVILQKAVSYGDWPAEERIHRYFHCGLGAYDAFAETVRQGPDRNGPETCCDVLHFGLWAMLDARAAAGSIFQENAHVHEAFDEAGIHFDQEAGFLKQALETLTGTPPGGHEQIISAMMVNIEKPDVREQAAALIEQAADEYVLAIEALRPALADFSPTEPAAPAAAATPDDDAAAAKAKADELYRSGKQLKAARRFAEAEKALRQAIELAPEHVEAHWVLAWVLIELKRPDDAIKELETVVKLAPDTDRAREAQKAIHRLRGAIAPVSG